MAAKSTPRSWNDPPALMVVSGNQHFLREREIRKALWAASINHRSLDFIDGGDTAELNAKVSGSVLFSQEGMVIVTNPQKADLDLLKSHHEDGDGDLCLVLHYEGKIRGNTKFGKFVASLPSWQHQQFEQPPKHKATEKAVSFCQIEAERLKSSLDKKLATSLVRVMGTDFGLLAFEVRKAVAYAKSQGDSAVEARHIKSVVSGIGETDAVMVTDALGSALGPRALNAMARVRKSSDRDPTMLLVALISNNAVKWLQAASLDKMGIDPENAARQVGLHPYVYKRFILPVGKRWGEAALVRLIKEMSRVERAVKMGAINPWVMLEASVLASCKAVGRRP